MSLLVALFLGLVQGLTEFFPVSSSAHLKLAKLLCGVKETPVIFDLACHLGTLGALLWFFKEDILSLFRGGREKLLHLFVALLPLFPVYFFLSPLRDMVSRPHFLGFFMMTTGGMLLVGQKLRLKKKKGFLYDILWIGAMQSAALVPGISRSASTISTAQVLGWNVKDAVRFSFLLAIPTILGGNLMEFRKLWKEGQMAQCINLPCFVGFLTSLVIGLFVIRFAIRWLEKGKMEIFAWYCLILGMLVNMYLLLR